MKILETKKLENTELFELMFESLQNSKMPASYKREQIMSSMYFVLKDNRSREFNKWTTFGGIIKFIEEYQPEHHLQNNFSSYLNQSVTNLDEIINPASLRISNVNFRERRFTH